MRILHFEDNTTKYMAIHSVVQSLGIEDITWVESVEERNMLCRQKDMKS